VISNIRGLVKFTIKEKSFKKKDFLRFLKELREENSDFDLNIVLDNCRVHIGKDVKRISDKHNLNLIFNKPYSPHLNGIELYWAQCK